MSKTTIIRSLEGLELVTGISEHYEILGHGREELGQWLEGDKIIVDSPSPEMNTRITNLRRNTVLEATKSDSERE